MSVKLHIITYLFFLLVYSNHAYIDLFLEEEQAYQIFGVSNSQLYYVNNGSINKNAVNFVGQLTSHQNIYFSMRSTSAHKVLYDIEVYQTGQVLNAFKNNTELENKNILFKKMNQTDSGHIANLPMKYLANITCSGSVSGKVFLDIKVTFRVSIDEFTMRNNTVVLKRIKQCFKESFNTTKKETVLSTTAHHLNSKVEVVPRFKSDQFNRDSTQAFFISISVFTTIVFVFVFMVAIMHCRSSRKKDQHEGPVSCHFGPGGAEIYNQYLRPDVPNNVATKNSSSFSPGSLLFMPLVNNLGNGDISDLANKLSDISIDRKELTCCEVLMKGTFARICNGNLKCETPVYIKTVSAQATNMQKRLLIIEALLFKNINHQNVLKVKNFINEKDDSPPMILYPYTSEERNLKYYLQGMTLNDKSGDNFYSRSRNEQITSQELVEMAIQICGAMEHLSQCGIVHKDLATRNCVISLNGHVKVTDNALSRDIFPADYCCLGDNENRPVRWLALESLIHKVYTLPSDVWSFGVVLWELESFGGLPYADIDDFEMETSLRDGYRLSRPLSCPDYLYSLMVRCWHYSPHHRPTFAKLRKHLIKFHDELLKYV